MIQAQYGEVKKRSVFWGCGYSFLIAQWLSNGSFGSSWLPKFSGLGDFAIVGQVLIYSSYVVFLLLLGVKGAKRLAPFNGKFWLLTGGTLCIVCGDLLAFLAGSGFIGTWLYVAGMMIVGLGMAVMMLAWGEFYCAIGARMTCVVLALCFIIGSTAFSLIGVISAVSLPMAIVVQLCLIVLSQLMLMKAWKSAESTQDVVLDEKPPFAIRPLMPYLLTVLVLGLMLGIIIGLNSAQANASPPIVWTIGMSAMGTIIAIGALASKHFSLDNFSRTLIPILVMCALLIPVLSDSYIEIFCILGCAGYVLARIFYLIAYVSIAQTQKIPVLPLVACAIATDSLGIIAREIICAFTFPNAVLSMEMTYVVMLLAVSLIIVVGSLFLRDKYIISLWGFKRLDFSEEVIERKCMEIAVKQELTFRETEVLVMLAKGLVSEEIAQDLSISVATLRTHTRNIYAKLDVHSQPELIRTVVFDSAV